MTTLTFYDSSGFPSSNKQPKCASLRPMSSVRQRKISASKITMSRRILPKRLFFKRNYTTKQARRYTSTIKAIVALIHLRRLCRLLLAAAALELSLQHLWHTHMADPVHKHTLMLALHLQMRPRGGMKAQSLLRSRAHSTGSIEGYGVLKKMMPMNLTSLPIAREAPLQPLEAVPSCKTSFRATCQARSVRVHPLSKYTKNQLLRNTFAKIGMEL